MEMIVEAHEPRQRKAQALSDAPGVDTDTGIVIDDIGDPPVPPAVLQEVGVTPPPDALWRQHEALVQSCCTELLARFSKETREIMGAADTIYGNLLQIAGARIETQAAANEHAAYQFSDALLTLHDDGLTVAAAPYTVQIQARSPAGYLVTFTLVKKDLEGFLQGLQGLQTWLAQAQYTPER